MPDNNLLETYPVQACSFEKNDGIVTVHFVNPKPGLIEKVFFKKVSSKPYKIDFDEIGSFIWQLCDGQNSVEEIVKKGKEHFGDKIEPSEERVTMFVEQLVKNKFIKLFKKK